MLHDSESKIMAMNLQIQDLSSKVDQLAVSVLNAQSLTDLQKVDGINVNVFKKLPIKNEEEFLCIESDLCELETFNAFVSTYFMLLFYSI